MTNFVFAVLSALLILAPLVFSPKSSELFEFPKLLLIYFGASLLLPTIFWKLSKKKEALPPLWVKLVFAALGLFVFSQLASTLFSIDKHVSLFGYYSRFNGGLFSLLSYVTLLITSWYFLNPEHVQKLLKITLGAGILVALWGLPSHFGRDFICLAVIGEFSTGCWTNDFIPEKRMFATLGQPNWLATYLLVLIFIVLYYFITGQGFLTKKLKQYNPFINLGLLALFSLELIWTNSKSGILAYIIMVAFFFAGQFLLNRKKLLSLLKTSFYIPLLILLIVIGTQVTGPLQRITSSLKPVESKIATKTQSNNTAPADHITPSSDIRLIVWQGAWELGQKFPLFGTGVETFAYGYYLTRPTLHNLTSEWNFVYNKAHNELLNYFATTGYFGLISYLLLFIIFLAPAVTTLFKRGPELAAKKQFSLFYLSSMLAIFIMNFFGFSTTLTSLLFFLLPALLLIVLYKETPVAVTVAQKNALQEVSFGQLAIYFAWLLFAFVYLLNYYSADFNYARGREYKQIQDFNNAYLYTDKALSLRKSEPTYLDQQAGIAANWAAILKIQKQNPQVKELSQKAQDYNRLSLESAPQNVFYYKTRAKVYYFLSLTNLENTELAESYLLKAEKALETAMTLAPTDPVLPYTLASLLVEKDLIRAQELNQAALSLKPDYTEAKELFKHLQNN